MPSTQAHRKQFMEGRVHELSGPMEPWLQCHAPSPPSLRPQVQGTAGMQVLLHSKESGLPWWLSGKDSACQCRRRRFNPWVRKIPWRKKR